MSALDPDPTLDGPARGRGILAVLVDGRSVELLEAVRDWADRGTLEFAVAYAGKPLSDRITRFNEMGLLAKRSARGGRRGHEHRLTAAGEAALALREHLAAAAGGLDAAHGERAKLVAASVRGRWDLVVGRVVLDGAERFTDVLRVARGLARSWAMEEADLSRAGLTRRLRRLEQLGVVAVKPAPQRRAVRYTPGPRMWRVARPALAVSLWHCCHRPQSIPPVAGDLLALIEMLIDRVQLDRDLDGTTIVLHVQPPEGTRGWLDAPLCVEERRLHVLPGAPDSPTAYVEGPLRSFCEALLGGDFGKLTIDGERPKALSVLTSLTAAMRES